MHCRNIYIIFVIVKTHNLLYAEKERENDISINSIEAYIYIYICIVQNKLFILDITLYLQTPCRPIILSLIAYIYIYIER